MGSVLLWTGSCSSLMLMGAVQRRKWTFQCGIHVEKCPDPVLWYLQKPQGEWMSCRQAAAIPCDLVQAIASMVP